MNNYIFTDIDGVLNPKYKKKLDKNCVNIYNKICNDFNLIPIITSTWRVRYNIEQLQQIFNDQKVNVNIYDYTPILNEPRGMEIKQWSKDNKFDKYIIIDDKISDILPYFNNVIHCKGF